MQDLGNLPEGDFQKFVEEGLSVTLSGKGIEKAYAEAVINFLLRSACTPVTEATASEAISRRCVNLTKLGIGWWPAVELRLGWMEKQFASVHAGDQQPGPAAGAGGQMGPGSSAGAAAANQGNTQVVFGICIGLEVLTYLVNGPMEKSPERILACINPLQKSLAVCLTSSNHKVSH